MALSQPKFAKLLREAMGDDIGDSELSERTRNDGTGKPPIDRKTIGNYQKADYANGPPDDKARRRLERALEVYRNYFEEAWPDVPVEEQKRRVRRGEEPTSARHVSPGVVREPIAEYMSDPPDSSGLELGDGDEEHLRDFLRSITLTIAGNVKPRETKLALRLLRLGALEAYEHSLLRRGARAPRYFATIRKEILNDRLA